MKVTFFANGNTAVTDKDKQIPELQESWLALFVKYLDENEVNPTKHVYQMPDGNKFSVYRITNGYNWGLYRDDPYKELCANCASTKGAHHGGSTTYPYNYCPGHEGRMDWDKGPGTVFKSSGEYKEEEDA